jgi:hypothetical protein
MEPKPKQEPRLLEVLSPSRPRTVASLQAAFQDARHDHSHDQIALPAGLPMPSASSPLSKMPQRRCRQTPPEGLCAEGLPRQTALLKLNGQSLCLTPTPMTLHYNLKRFTHATSPPRPHYSEKVWLFPRVLLISLWISTLTFSQFAAGRLLCYVFQGLHGVRICYGLQTCQVT